MIEPILATAANFNRVYLIGDGMLFFLLFLWNNPFMKIFYKWTLFLATLAVAVTLTQG